MPAPPPNLPALVLAAGRGERMRPLTDRTPKPLLPVNGRPMLAWHLDALARAGVRRVVVNTAWLGEQFPAALGDGSRWGIELCYSHEGLDHGRALETAGAIATALPLLGESRFWLVSGDIVAPGFPFAAEDAARFAARDDDAHLWLVNNPDFHPDGDFALSPEGRLRLGDEGAAKPYTYANLALVHARLVDGIVPGTVAKLGPLLRAAAAAGRAGGECLQGFWANVGTPQQWQAVQAVQAAAVPLT